MPIALGSHVEKLGRVISEDDRPSRRLKTPSDEETGGAIAAAVDDELAAIDGKRERVTAQTSPNPGTAGVTMHESKNPAEALARAETGDKIGTHVIKLSTDGGITIQPYREGDDVTGRHVKHFIWTHPAGETVGETPGGGIIIIGLLASAHESEQIEGEKESELAQGVKSEPELDQKREE